MRSFKTDQEVFWAGQFGDDYVDRNNGADAIAANIALFSKILSRTDQVNSVLELGANLGLNLHALKTLRPSAVFSAVEINDKAIKHLQQLKWVQPYHQSLLDFQAEAEYDLVLIKGVLIHINPDFIDKVYNLLYQASCKYILVIEYFNPVPVEVTYRGHENKLFKRDFAGDLLDKYPDLKLVDYGFSYHRDPNFPQDDTTWFLMKKTT
ncbi:pseudaminic acid biosynthesis-associated methylase [Acaryochloris sp. CCMEE 5410]|uniref:pseudaminic acid biosynthesis-associated methylase n=1 Tax=Acaryochloris sp. CCMEE 5410 TaxID=310037 RepID=UPI00024841D0|nr:pseudaminic acid biosynthesis-associated methylase [Acaryochloris sp. CCMEE 5410]KAI9135244.1 pseudaminic acid biosynthesis-associated methylase [Acaryochloris sp. CCMEE 5410]